MNIYEALYYLNKKTKELSKKREEIKAILDSGDDLKDKKLIQEIFRCDCVRQDADSVAISPVFPCEFCECETANSYKDIREYMRVNNDETHQFQNEILMLQDELDDAEPDKIKEINARIDELNEWIEGNDELDTEIRLVIDKLEESYYNRGQIIKYLKELREQQIDLYSMKEKVLYILKLPITAIHMINEKKYKYYHVQFEGKEYGYHSPCRDDDDEEVSDNQVIVIDYEPTTIEITDEIYNEAYALVVDFIEDNDDILEDYKDPYEEKEEMPAHYYDDWYGEDWDEDDQYDENYEDDYDDYD